MACKKDSVPQPEYTINPGDIMIKFTAPEDRVIRVTERVTVKVTDKVTDTLDVYYGEDVLKRLKCFPVAAENIILKPKLLKK